MMENHFAILRIAPNAHLEDKISLGLFVFSEDRLWFHYDLTLLRYLKPLMPDRQSTLEKILKIIARKVKSLNPRPLDLYKNTDQFYKREFFHELSSLKTGFIQISSPSPLELSIRSERDLIGFYQNLIGDWKIKRPVKANREYKKIQQALVSNLQNQVHTNLYLNAKHIKGLYYRYLVEAIGKKDHFLITKYLDFRQTNQTVERKVMRLFYLIDLIETQYNKAVHVNIVGSPPTKRQRSKERYYQLIINHPKCTFYFIDDLLQILKKYNVEGYDLIWELET